MVWTSFNKCIECSSYFTTHVNQLCLYMCSFLSHAILILLDSEGIISSAVGCTSMLIKLSSLSFVSIQMIKRDAFLFITSQIFSYIHFFRVTIQEAASRLWLTYYENERKCVYSQTERIQSQLQSVSD